MNTRTILLAGLLLSFTVSLIVNRSIIFEDGLILFGDFAARQDTSLQRSYLWHTWDKFMSTDSGIFLVHYPVYSWLLLIEDVAITQKVLLFLLYFLTPLLMFLATFYWLRKRYEPKISFAVAVSIAIFYTINPWTAAPPAGIVGQWARFLAYALTPLIVFLTFNALSKNNWKDVLRHSLIVGALLAMTLEYSMIALHALLVLFIILVYTAFSLICRAPAWRTVKYSAIVATSATSALILFSLPWLAPALSYYTTYYGQGHSGIVINANNLIGLVQGVDLLHIMTLYYTQAIHNELTSYLPSALGSAAISLILIFPILAFLAIVLRPHERVVQVLSLIALGSIFMSKGPLEPAGEIFWKFLSVPSVSSLATIFGTAYKYADITVFAFSILSAFSVAEIIMRINKKINEGRWRKPNIILSKFATFSVLSLIIILSAVLNGGPLIEGFPGKELKPVKVPQQYTQLNQWLDRDTEYYRVSWFPPYGSPLWAQNTPTIGLWLSKKPVFSLGPGILALGPSNSKVYDFYIYDKLVKGETQYIGKLFSAELTKYVIYDNNTTTSSNNKHLLKSLMMQNDLSLDYGKDGIFVFTNTHSLPYVNGIETAILTVGGLDVFLPLINTEGYSPSNVPVIFLEMEKLSPQTFSDVTKISNTLVLSEGKDLNDLVMTFIDEKYLYTPSEIVTIDQTRNAWIKESFSYGWLGRLEQYNGIKYDFVFGKGILFASNDEAELSMETTTEHDGTYDIWIRASQYPKGGTLKLLADNFDVGEANFHSPEIKGFKWIKVGTRHFAAGNHRITVVNENGSNAINMLSIIPTDILLDYTKQIQDVIDKKGIHIYHLDNMSLPHNVIKHENVTKKQTYILDQKALSATEYVITVNATRPFLLSFNEGYSPFWQATAGNHVFAQIALNSITNGFIIDKMGAYTIKIDYLPERAFSIGKMSFVASFCIWLVLLIYLDDKYRYKFFRMGLIYKRISNWLCKNDSNV